MFNYILKRLLLFIPTLLIISWVVFALTKATPGDPIEPFLNNEDNSSNYTDAKRYEENYASFAKELKLDKPSFYFAIQSAAFPDTLYKILKKERKETQEKLISQYGNWTFIQAYFKEIKAFEANCLELPDSIDKQFKIDLIKHVQPLWVSADDETIKTQLETLDNVFATNPTIKFPLLQEKLNTLKNAYQAIQQQPTRNLLYIPNIIFYGLDNQYHHWFSHLLKGNLGVSNRDRRPVAAILSDALKWTVFINSIAIILAYLLAIPIGVFAAKHQGTWKERFLNTTLFFLHALPVFWVATLLVVFFTTDMYGIALFPSIGLGDVSSLDNFFTQLKTAFPHLILPIICLVYGSLALIARQIQRGMNQALASNYIRTAKAKGLSEGKIIWTHAFKNAIFPIVALFASVLPAAIAGSLVVEVICNIPGMGKVMYDAILYKDWNVVYAVLLLGAILTMFGTLLADIVLAWLDPRVKF